MTASGVFNSCDTLATKSCRTRSALRTSVTSWTTTTAPGAPGPGNRDTYTARLCAGGPFQSSSSRCGPVPASPFSTVSRNAAGRTTSHSFRPTAAAGSNPSSRPARSLAKSTRWSWSIAITPSTMPDRMVRNCSRSCSSWANVAASRSLIVLIVSASAACSRPPETRILWPRSPSASRRAPSLSSSIGRANIPASRYAIAAAATSTSGTPSPTWPTRSANSARSRW